MTPSIEFKNLKPILDEVLGLGLSLKMLHFIELCLDGLTHKQIAEQLGITEKSSKERLTSVNKALGMSSRIQLTSYFYKLIIYKIKRSS